MSYPHIVAILDAELELLQRVRNLLTSSPTLVEKPRKQQVQPTPAPAETTEGDGVNELTPAMGFVPAQLKTSAKGNKLATRHSKREEKPGSKNPPASASALGGIVPTGPVYVSAEQIRKAQVQKEAEDGMSPNNASSADDFPNAAMLSQRWLNGSGN